MPNRDVHVNAGMGLAVCATVAAAIASNEKLTLEEMCMRVLGAVFGGYIGARVPDVIDPSSRGPNHRSIGHGVLPNGTIYALGCNKFLDVRSALLENCDSQNHLFNQLIVGAMDGFVAGHISHLALDSRTPKGLPAIA